jgi:hypothetical protein
MRLFRLVGHCSLQILHYLNDNMNRTYYHTISDAWKRSKSGLSLSSLHEECRRNMELLSPRDSDYSMLMFAIEESSIPSMALLLALGHPVNLESSCGMPYGHAIVELGKDEAHVISMISLIFMYNYQYSPYLTNVNDKTIKDLIRQRGFEYVGKLLVS